MANEHAKPGDTIEDTRDGSSWHGQQFVVIECPDECKENDLVPDGVAWFLLEETEVFLRPGDYKIIKRGSGRDSKCQCGDVDAKLRKQLNDNLDSVFG